MRRRFGVPLTAALLLVLFMVRPFWPFAAIEPYYVLAGLSTLWAVIDSIRLQVSKHGSSPLLSPVALAAWMLIAWPLAFPWYLKVHYLVSNGESADNVGSFAAIRLAFMGMLVAGGALFVGGAAVIGKYFPGVRNFLATSLLVSREMSKQFGGSADLALNDRHELVITMGQERPDDSLANQRFARQVARYARTHFPGADSLKSIEVVLQGSGGAKDHGRYKWTLEELNAGGPPSSGTVQVAAGTYRENVTVPKNVQVTGAGVTTIVEPAVSDPNCGGAGGASLCAGASNVFLVQSNDVEIDHLKVDGDNPTLTSGESIGGADIDARNGIITNHLAGVYNNLSVHNVTVKNIFLRGIYASSGGTFNISNNVVDNVQGQSAGSIGIFNYLGAGTISGNQVSRPASRALSGGRRAPQYTSK